MTYPTLINVAYWTLLAFIVLLAWICVGMGVAILWLRSRRFAQDRAVRLARIERLRQERPPYDPEGWQDAVRTLAFGGHGAALVELVADAQKPKQVRGDKPVRLVTV